jgi:hypothetical protein
LVSFRLADPPHRRLFEMEEPRLLPNRVRSPREGFDSQVLTDLVCGSVYLSEVLALLKHLPVTVLIGIQAWIKNEGDVQSAFTALFRGYRKREETAIRAIAEVMAQKRKIPGAQGYFI